MGRGSFGYLIAQIAIETGIAPQYLLDLDSTMLDNMVKVFEDRAERLKDAKRGNKR